MTAGALVQLGLATFGLASLFMAMSHHPLARKWAPVVGLAGQPFWVAFAWATHAWGLLVTVAGFTAVYSVGLVKHWRPRRLLDQPAPADDATARAAHEKQQALVLLAAEIADVAAIEDVLGNCPAESFGNSLVTWYDTARAGAGPGEPEGDQAAIEGVEQSVRYLDMRGFVVFHPQQRHLVRIAP